jgi:hypothetical protein
VCYERQQEKENPTEHPSAKPEGTRIEVHQSQHPNYFRSKEPFEKQETSGKS